MPEEENYSVQFYHVSYIEAEDAGSCLIFEAIGEAEVGSLFWVSLGKLIQNNLWALCNSGGLKEH